MRKVKRKQIEFDGTDEQYIKGDGELGNISDLSSGENTSDIIYCNFIKDNNSIYSIIEDGEGTLTISIPEIYLAAKNGKTVICKYKPNNVHVELILNINNISYRGDSYAPLIEITFVTKYEHFIYTITAVWQAEVNEETFDWDNEPDWEEIDLLPINDYNTTYEKANIVVSNKTFNNEYLDSKGNSNLNDGFYFPNAVCDYDGNWYGAIIIGNQVWLGENLRCKHYSDSTPIIESDGNSTTSAYIDRTGSAIPIEKRGLFYNMYAVLNGSAPTNRNPSNIQGIAPVGFHVPSLSEYTELCDYISQQERYNWSYGWGHKCHLKTIASNNYWESWIPINYALAPGYDITHNNKTGFNLIPTGRLDGIEGHSSYLWTVTQGAEENTAVYVYGIDNHADQTAATFVVSENSYATYNTYFPIRCVSDLDPIQFRNWYVSQYGSMQHLLNENGGSLITFRHW